MFPQDVVSQKNFMIGSFSLTWKLCGWLAYELQAHKIILCLGIPDELSADVEWEDMVSSIHFPVCFDKL